MNIDESSKMNKAFVDQQVFYLGDREAVLRKKKVFVKSQFFFF